MKKKLFIGLIFFVSVMLLSTNSVLAYCSMPAAYRDNGSGLDLISGIEERSLIKIDQSDHSSDSWIDYNLQIKNKNSNQGILVYLQSETSQGNVLPGSVFLDPDEKGNLTVRVWVRQNKFVEFRFTGVCDDGTHFDNYIKPKLEFMITSHEDITPQTGCDIPPSQCDMTTGLYTTYYCDGTEVKSISRCVNSCCQSYGQQFGDNQAFCTLDKHRCISTAGIEPTEGRIAFLCKSDDCKYENDIMLILKLLGWEVDGKSYKNWLESDFNDYDIIACYDQAACKVSFNSPAYNAHVVNRKPFLEISKSKYIPAAYEFGYITKTSGYGGKQDLFVTSEDELTEGFYHSSVDVVTKLGQSFAVIKDSYLDINNTPELKDLADSGYDGDKQGSVFFKVDETVGHGKYAFIGWLTNFKKEELNADGETLLRRTLQWLKTTSPIGERKKIAFICSKDACSDRDEVSLIKLFRRWGFFVNGKSLASWGNETNNYDLIICRNSRTSCMIPLTSPVYYAHTAENVPFLEIPETSKAYAAQTFGLLSLTSYSSIRRYSNYSIQVNTSDPIVSGLGDFISIFYKRRPIIGVAAGNLHSVKDIAHLTNQPYSTLFTSESASKYAFIGWLGKSNLVYMNENAKEILHRTVNWLICGNISC